MVNKYIGEMADLAYCKKSLDKIRASIRRGKRRRARLLAPLTDSILVSLHITVCEKVCGQTREELKKLKTVFNKHQTMNLLFCQKKHRMLYLYFSQFCYWFGYCHWNLTFRWEKRRFVYNWFGMDLATV